MFKFLSKESNIFSIPVYIGFLLLIIIFFNILNFSGLHVFPAIVTFTGIALGYFCFNAIGLTYQTHVPLFLYTFFVFAFYPGKLDIGIAVSLLTNSILILILTANDEETRRKAYVLVGTIVALNFIFLPATWPMFFFVLVHIIATSDRIGLHLFRFFYGLLLIGAVYFGVVYFLDYNSWNDAYFPFRGLKPVSGLDLLLYLSPTILMAVYAVADHFMHYNQKSPVSRYKYTFLLVFAAAQLITIVMYMGLQFEYLLLLALPVTIFVSRMLRFLPKYWMRELGLWVITGSLLSFKLAGFF